MPPRNRQPKAVPVPPAPPVPASLRLRCAKAHEYVGEPMTLTIDAAGAMVRRLVLVCPFCVLALAQTVETQVVGEVPGKAP
jgi:hypothetical protein